MAKETLLAGFFHRIGGRASQCLAVTSAAGVLTSTISSALNVGAKVIVPETSTIVVAGSFTTPDFSIARFFNSGATDPSFAPDIGGAITHVIPDGTGYFILGTMTLVSGVTTQGFARLNNDGTRDWSPTLAATAKAMALHAGGILVSHGTSTTVLARFSLTGTPDAGFTSPAFNGSITQILVQGDGKIVVGGNFTTVNAVAAPRIVRLNADGSVDGTWTTPSGGHWAAAYNVRQILPCSNGDLYVTFIDGSNTRIAKISANGGAVTFTANASPPMAGDIVVDADDGYAAWEQGTSGIDVRRYFADGSAHPGYDGVVQAMNSSPQGTLLYLPDDSLLVAGNFDAMFGVPVRGVVRILPDGTRDTSFNPGFDGSVDAMARRSDGSFVFAGGFGFAGMTYAPLLSRLLSDNTPDPDFAVTTTLVGVAGTAAINRAVQAADGRIYIAGFFSLINAHGTSRAFSSFGRLMPDGEPDTTFKDPYLRASTAPAVINDFSIDPDGKIVVVGGLSEANGFARSNIARINTDGTIDGPFNPPTINNDTTCIIRLADGKYLVGGVFSTVNGVAQSGVARFNADGTHDTAFADPVINVLDPTRQVFQMALQGDGKLIIAGTFTSVGGSAAPGLARLNTDGTRDATFVPASSGTAFSVAIDPADGSVYVGRSASMRKHTTTGADATWTNPFTSGHIIRDIVVHAGGVIVSGDFELSGRNGLAYLTAAGAFDSSVPVIPVLTTTGASTVNVISLDYVDRPALHANIKAVYAPAFETRAGTITCRVYGGTAPYTVDVDGRSPDGLALAGNLLSGTYTRPGRYIWDMVVRDAVGATATLRVDRRVYPIAAPGALLVTAQSIFRVDDAGDAVDTPVTTNGITGMTFAKRLRDRSVVVTGDFSLANGNSRNRLIRLLPDGTLDLSFPSVASVSNQYRAADLQSDGSLILVGGTLSSPFTSVVHRVSPAGVLDATFVMDSVADTNYLSAVKVLADDRLVFGGSGDSGTSDRGNPVVFRTDPNGDLDDAFLTAFGGAATSAQRFTGGSGLRLFWSNDQFIGATAPSSRAVYDLDFTADGTRIIVVGGFTSRSTTGAVVTRVDQVGINGGYAKSPWISGIGGDTYYETANVFRVFANADNTITCIGAFSAQGTDALDSGLVVIDEFGNFVGGATNGGASAPALDRVERMADGRFYATHSREVDKAVRLFPDGEVDTTFSPVTTFNVVAIIPDDDGIDGFSGDGLVGVALEAELAEGDAVDTVELSESVVLSSSADATLQMLLLARLLLEGAETAVYEGTAQVNDTVVLGDPLFYVMSVLIEEGLVVGDDITIDYTVFARVVARLLMSGAATGYADAVVHVLDALVMAGLAQAMAKGDIAETVVLADTIAGLYQAFVQILELLVASDAATGTSTAYVLLAETVVLARDLAHEAELAVLLRDSVGFAATLSFDNGEYIAWVMNTDGDKPVSRYTQFPFNSFAKVGGRYMACDSTGLHWLEGNDDNGEAIRARLRAGLQAMGTRRLKRMPEAFIAYRSDGTLLLRLIQTNEDTGEKEAGVFLLKPRPAGNTRENRFKPGRGWKAVEFDFELENVDGAAFDITALEFRPLYLDRRTRG